MREPPDTTTLDALRLETERHQLRSVFWILLIPLAAFTVADLSVADAGEHVALRLLARACIVLVLWVGFVKLPPRLERKQFSPIVTSATMLSAPFLLAMHVMRPRDSLAFFAVDAVLVAALYGLIPNERRWQTVSALSLSLGALGLLFWWHVDVTPMEMVTVVTSLGVANAAGLSAAWYRERREEREEAIFQREQAARMALEQTMAELRTLRGILPICAHCRRIREDDGEWQAIEAYVRRHSSAEFSHGICPTCLEQHYGETMHGPPPRPSSP